MTGRPVRPGEMPKPLSIWRWTEAGTPILVLGLVSFRLGSSRQLHLVGLMLEETHPVINESMIWTIAAHVGVGPVLTGWNCIQEAPE